MTALRHDPAARRLRQQSRASALKRRFTVGSVIGFGALIGLVAEHAVGSTKNTVKPASTVARTSASSTTFFDSTDSGYTFDDSGVASGSGSASAGSSGQPPPPVAQSSAS